MEILNMLGNQSESLLAALDSVYIKCGIQNFGAYRKLVEFITKGRSALGITLIRQIDAVEKYIKEQLPKHLKEHSTCKSHSYDYLLNPLNGDREGNCDEEEEEYCHHCSQIQLLQINIDDAISTMLFDHNPPDSEEGEDLHEEPSNADPESKANVHIYAATLHADLKTYWTHKVRSVHEKNQLANSIDGLLDHQCILISDWKMKLQMLLFRESMVEFYGKRGIPWLGVMIIRKKLASEKKPNDTSNCIVEFTDVLMDDTKEDGPAVAAIFVEILKTYKARHPHITEAIPFTDGAGCFSGNFLFLYITRIGELTGIKITSVFVSEAGCGKTPHDAHFGMSRVHIINSVKAGRGKNDIRNGAQAVQALQCNGGVRGTTAMVMQMLENPPKIKQVPKLKQLMHRTYHYDGDRCVSVTLRAFYNRGQGTVLLRDQLDSYWTEGVHPGILRHRVPLVAESEKERKDFAVSPDDKAKKVHERDKRSVKRQKKNNERNEAAAAEREKILTMSKLLACSTPKCTAAFQQKASLEKHEEAGVHYYGRKVSLPSKNQYLPTSSSRLPPQKPFTDLIISKASDRITMYVQKADTGPEVATANGEELKKCHTYVSPVHGRAIKVSKVGKCLKGPRKNFRINAAQLQLVVDIFDLGETAKAFKSSPEQAEEMFKLVGTRKGAELWPEHPYMVSNVSGFPTFSMKDWLQVVQIKGYFSKTRKKLHKQLFKLLRKQAQNGGNEVVIEKEASSDEEDEPEPEREPEESEEE
jgi:hypothetical protein